MGGDWYARAYGDALFEVPKPLTTLGMGVDQLPESIRKSLVLTGNDLGMLGNTEVLPDADSIEVYLRMHKELMHIHQTKTGDDLQLALHAMAHQLLLKKEVMDAWKVLLSAE